VGFHDCKIGHGNSRKLRVYDIWSGSHKPAVRNNAFLSSSLNCIFDHGCHLHDRGI
jgi:hypothetical protein